MCLLLSLAGCRQRFVACSIENDTGQPLQMVEMDYPGGSFGESTLAAHRVYAYRFKALGSGPLSLSYADQGGVTHSFPGPVIEEDRGGRLNVHIREGGQVAWQAALTGG